MPRAAQRKSAPTSYIGISQLLKLEEQCRKAEKYFIYCGEVCASDGTIVYLQIKSLEFFNQLLRINNESDQSAGHSCPTVAMMHKHITDCINKTALTSDPNNIRHIAMERRQRNRG